MDLIVSRNGSAEWGGHWLRCALGRGGVRADKQEGDGATPQGKWRMRALLFRPDRITRTPLTNLPIRSLRAEDGWCDDAADPLYNRPVKLPFRARAEHLWREDGIYDLIVVLGYNDDPPVPGKGSAIFLHIARSDYSPTDGCIAVGQEDLLAIAASADTGSSVVVG
jgi:L,D-peptidoglycan transpeptidase YkuD (ErfK/YbiS/YcfS/YnhG family)